MTALLLAILLAVDLGGGACQQDDGQGGYWDVDPTFTGDGCITPAEYRVIFSVESMLEYEAIVGFYDNGDGTTTLIYPNGDLMVVATDPLQRKAAVGPLPEPDAPTMGELIDQMSTVALLEELRVETGVVWE